MPPIYDYRCESCNKVTEHSVSFGDRLKFQPCSCGGIASYKFPVEAIKGFQPFSEYYDESLGMDIHGRREKKQILKAFGLVEAGDIKKGARNIEVSTWATPIKPLPPVGTSLSEMQRREEEGRKAMDSFEISTIEKTTRKTVMPKTKLTELPSA